MSASDMRDRKTNPDVAGAHPGYAALSLLLQNVEPDGETDDQALDDQLVE
jgi:hypothetical protein